MASQKQSLTAEEVDANPSIIRHPDARHKTRNRSGQAAGAYGLSLVFSLVLMDLFEVVEEFLFNLLMGLHFIP